MAKTLVSVPAPTPVNPERRMPASRIRTGFVGGPLGYRILSALGHATDDPKGCTGSAYQEHSKLEILFGPEIWRRIDGKTVVDVGCGLGAEAIDMARHGARRVVGIDILDRVLETARTAARREGVADRCVFTRNIDQTADVVISVDAFEHYDDPDAMVSAMLKMLNPGGEIFATFGPTWFHPYGGHLFSVFPWAHLIFTEPALIRWRSDFKTDGATRFSEVEGGLNQMTIRAFRHVVTRDDVVVKELEAVPIRRLRRFHNRLTEEFFTSYVRCRLGARQT